MSSCSGDRKGILESRKSSGICRFSEKDYRALDSYGCFVLLETLKSDSLNNRSYIFTEPVRTIETKNLEEIEASLEKMDEAVRNGFFVAGYFEYEAGYAMEEKLQKKIPASSDRPLLWLGVFESVKEFQPAGPGAGCSERSTGIENITEGISFNEYKDRIERIKEYIAGGDTYQINYTFPLYFSFTGSPFDLYFELSKKQKVSYAAMIKLPQGKKYILSLSPELFFAIRDGKIFTRPMKGTMRRGRTAEEDAELSEKLATCEKNRAENVMIVDLLRNDIGKICRTGTVEVIELFRVEKYETLFQMTSTIRGELEKGVTVGKIFKNLFPCGSVTGAPKIRSMEIIRELEGQDRGVYCGAAGFVAPDGDATFSVAIRTVELVPEDREEKGKDKEKKLAPLKKFRGKMGTGSGIVWDSDAEEEFKECLLKKKFLSEKTCEFELFETMLVRGRRIRLLKYHLERLSDSACYFNINLEKERVVEALERYLRDRAGDRAGRIIKIIVSPDGKIRIEEREFREKKKDSPGMIEISSERVDSSDRFLYHKTTMRPLYDRIRKECEKKGLVDMIFKNERDELTEGTIYNLFIMKDGELFTPPVSSGLLPGTMRRYILSRFRNAGEKVLHEKDLREADEIFLVNSVRGIRRVRLVEQEPAGNKSGKTAGTGR